MQEVGKNKDGNEYEVKIKTTTIYFLTRAILGMGYAA